MEIQRNFTVRVVLVSVFLAIIMAAANTYLALYAAMTISASIPAAVLARIILGRRSTVHQINIAQTMGASGEGLAAGLSFTLPALLLTGVWTTFHVGESLLVGVCGGILGILFMIPMRRALILESSELTYPEGLTCVEVVKYSATSGVGNEIVWGGIMGAVVKFFTAGVAVFQGTFETAFRAGRSFFYAGSDLSMALLGAGYVIRFNAATLVLMGGLFAWGIMIPLLTYGQPLPVDASPLDFVSSIWKTQVRYVGIGVMVVGGITTIVGMWRKIVDAVSSLKSSFRLKANDDVPIMDQDIRGRSLVILAVLCAIAILFLYIWQTPTIGSGIAAWVTMLVTGFLFVAVASYLCGLLGSSNNPVSGMIITTLIIAGVVLRIAGLAGNEGILASLIIAGVVCCAAAAAGAMSQDLKTGALLGTRPRDQQWGQIIGVVVAAPVVPLIMYVLHKAYTIGEGLPAVQAQMFGSIAKMFFEKGTTIPWNMLILGVFVGVALYMSDAVLKKMGSGFRLYVMAVGVGIYLPVSLAVPIFLGGLIDLLTSKKGVKDEDRSGTGIRFAAGLIAGEALMSIVLAVPIGLGYKTVGTPSALLSMAALAIGAIAMRFYAKKEASA